MVMAVFGLGFGLVIVALGTVVAARAEQVSRAFRKRAEASGLPTRIFTTNAMRFSGAVAIIFGIGFVLMWATDLA